MWARPVIYRSMTVVNKVQAAGLSVRSFSSKPESIFQAHFEKLYELNSQGSREIEEYEEAFKELT